MHHGKLVPVLAVSVSIGAALMIGRAMQAQNGDNGLGNEDNPCQGYPYPKGVVPCNLVPQIEKVLSNINKIEQETLDYSKTIPIQSGTRIDQIRTLGKLLLYDRNLSVFRNEPCVICHTRDTGFTPPIPEINETTVAFPGSVRYRFANRKPMSYAYAPFAPVFHLDKMQQRFFGGNFWDMKATGWKLQNPNSEQAQYPPVDFDEMGFPDYACAVHRLSQAPYEPLFEAIFANNLKRIQFPSDIDQQCQPTTPPMIPTNPGPVTLSDEDRMLAKIAYDQMAMAIAADEAGPDVSPFTSKFDYAIAHPDQQVLTAQEQQGWQLFRGKGKCNLCHLDTTSAIQKDMPETSFAEFPESEPLFTDYEAFNLGLPRNTKIPYYYEDKPDKYGVTPNPAGFDFIDGGLGDMLKGPNNPNSFWKQYASANEGKFQTATIRDVDKRPYPTFVKSYFHNGVVDSLKEVVHFYNTRDVLPKCPKGIFDPGFAKTCWAPPEVTQNENQVIGNLGLTSAEEDAIVAFMQTLTDGYQP